jgi:hypothetical protein
LTELAYVLGIAGVLLSITWSRVGSVYQDMHEISATKQLGTIIQAVRLSHLSSTLIENENVDPLNLPVDMLGHYKGRTIVYNPWKGLVTIFPGNAIGWGADHYNPEFTVRLDGIPSSACKPLIMQNTTSTMLGFGLIAVYVSPSPGIGREICFATDAFCKNIVTSLSADMIANLCKAHDPMTVMFSYSLH